MAGKKNREPVQNGKPLSYWKKQEEKRRAAYPDNVEEKVVANCELCYSCYFLSAASKYALKSATCDYILMTGNMRGEPVSEYCTKYRKKETARPKTQISLDGSLKR